MLDNITVIDKIKMIRKKDIITSSDKKEFFDLLKLCKKNYKDDVRVWSQIIKMFIKLKQYSNALDACDLFLDNEVIQSQKITILINLNCFDKALKVCEKFPDDDVIQLQKILIFVRRKKFLDALEICEKFPSSEIIQSNRIKVLIELERFDEALEICEKFPNCEKIQSQKITVLINLNQFDDALKVCEKFPNYERIQSQKITILINLNQFDEALEICEKFPNNMVIQTQRIGILSRQDVLDASNNLQLKSQILTDIYYNQITKEQIEKSKLCDYDKTILLIAYYEKTNKKLALQMIKNKKQENLSSKERKDYNFLFERLSSKKILFFDGEFYMKLLHCSIILDKVSTSEQHSEVVKELKNVTIKDKKSSNVSEKHIINNNCSQKYVSCNDNNKYKKTDSKNIPLQSIALTKKNISSILIKDIFKKEILEISKIIYLELYNPERQKDAIKAWDILENIANKSIDDKENLVKAVNLINKIFPDKMNLTQKKYMKFL